MGESVQQPWLYYDHNVLGAINLVEVMRKHNVKNVSLERPFHWPSCRACSSCSVPALSIRTAKRSSEGPCAGTAPISGCYGVM